LSYRCNSERIERAVLPLQQYTCYQIDATQKELKERGLLFCLSKIRIVGCNSERIESVDQPSAGLPHNVDIDATQKELKVG